MPDILPWNTKIFSLLSAAEKEDFASLFQQELHEDLSGYDVLRELVLGTKQSNRQDLTWRENWVRLLLEKGVAISRDEKAHEDFPKSPLFTVLYHNRLSLLKLMLQAQPNAYLGGDQVFLALHLNSSVTKKGFEALELLLQHGLRVSEQEVVKAGFKCWRWVELLLKYGHSYTSIDPEQKTTLLMTLLNSPRLSHVPRNKQIPWSLEELQSRMEPFLEAGVDLNAQDKFGWSALFYAASSCPEIVPYLIEKGCDRFIRCKEGNTWLHQAAINNPSEVLSQSFDCINELNDENQNPLHVLSAGLETSVLLSLSKEQVNSQKQRGLRSAQWLIDQGVEINALCHRQLTPWHHFVYVYPETLDFWIKNGADVDLKVGEVKISLFAFVSESEQGPLAMERLVELGFVPDEKADIDAHQERMSEASWVWVQRYLLNQSTGKIETRDPTVRRL